MGDAVKALEQYQPTRDQFRPQYQPTFDQFQPEIAISWPNEPLNSLRRRADTIGEELCAVVLGTSELDLGRLTDTISELGRVLGVLYRQSPRENFKGEEYQENVFRAPQGEPNLENIAVIQMEGSKHPPRHLRLMPRHWRKGEESGISRVEGLRDWAWYPASYADERPILITGYSIPFTEQGAIFIGLDLRLLEQWKDEVETHHSDALEWARKPFKTVIPEFKTPYNGTIDQLIHVARGNQ